MVDVGGMVCVILAGGRGKRMGSTECHKVCFPIAGRAAIVRAIDTYKQAGLCDFLVVVGQMAEQVMATVAAAHPEVSFVYQSEPRGTGHAALVAVESLAARGFDGHVLIVMGDKATRPETVRLALERYRETGADLLLSTLPKTPETTAGRVVEDDQGEFLGLVELADIRRAMVDGRVIPVGDGRFSGAAIEQRSTCVNVSMYVFRFGFLHEAVRHLSPANAQGELYLTDTAAYIAKHGRVVRYLVPDPRDIMAFNTPAELLAIEAIVRERERASLTVPTAAPKVDSQLLKPARAWLAVLNAFPAGLRQLFGGIYGNDAAVVEDRRHCMVQLVEAFIGQYGPERPMVLCRAPGRINPMGRHVDHRGGYVNVMAINKEALLAAAPREDDLVRLRNLRATRFPNREFRIFDLLNEASWADWMDFLQSNTARRVLDAAPGDWSHYVRAPLLRLQYEHRQTRLKGMDCMISGDIPMGAGLSSSSALVVAFAEAAVVLNGLDVAMRDFIDLCGEGEWFVGSRGGSADHAAIRTGHLGHISRIGFFPFRLAGEVPFPAGLRFVIAHSGEQAVKSAGARDVFNQRVACYEFAEMLLRRRWPAAAGIEHLRDLSPDHLQIEARGIYRGLQTLPILPSRAQIPALFEPPELAKVERVLATHTDVGPYDLRGVALFGISECRRSEQFAEIIGRGDFDKVRRFMRASHDGDRCVRFDRLGRKRRFLVRTDDAALEQLAQQDADLALCSGRYACSTESMDRLVDIATLVPGVVGAQMAGAGLGGCVMILAAADGLDQLADCLNAAFYAPRGLTAAEHLHVCTPVAGAGVLGYACTAAAVGGDT